MRFTARFRLLIPLLLTLPQLAHAQATNAGQVWAAPIYDPPRFMQRLEQQWALPLSTQLLQESEALMQRVDEHCNAAPQQSGATLKRAQAQWRATSAIWQQLSSIAIGPLIERRSLRQIDFTPTRPELIEKAIAQAPNTAKDMERIGTPAKGFPALEWLLWRKTALNVESPGCHYAQQVAADIARETQALQQAFSELAKADSEADDEDAVQRLNTAFSEFINQWVGGAERLRWAEMERPVLEAKSKSRSAARFPRALSGQTAAHWAASWQSLKTFTLAPHAGAEAEANYTGPVSLEAYLRGLGNASAADQLRRLAQAVDQALQGLTPQSPVKVQAAAKALARLKRYVEAEVAPALNISIGFSDADGD